MGIQIASTGLAFLATGMFLQYLDNSARADLWAALLGAMDVIGVFTALAGSIIYIWS